MSCYSMGVITLHFKDIFSMEARLFKDGDMFCALLGDNLDDGVAGFGPTIELAVADLMSVCTNKLAKDA
jgi:hypothetical protein